MAKRGAGQAGRAGTKAAALTRAKGGGSIIQRAIAGHPNWAGRPAHHGGAGAGAAGSALLGKTGGGARGGPGAAATTGTQTSAAPGGSAPPTVQPPLTPAQQQALNDWNAKYGESLGRLDQADRTAQARWTASTGAENLHFANSNDLTAQSMAARGLAQSSIRMNALNDLAVTHAAAINTINTNRDTALNNDQIARQDLARQNAAEQTFYNQTAVANAQSVTPVTGDNAGVAGTAPAAQHPGGTANPVQHPGTVQPSNTGLAAAAQQSAHAQAMSQAHNFDAANAARVRVTQPKPPATPKPKAPGVGKVALNIGPWAGAGGRVGAPR